MFEKPSKASGFVWFWMADSSKPVLLWMAPDFDGLRNQVMQFPGC